MNNTPRPSADRHREQINAYAAVYPLYEAFAQALRRVLEKRFHPFFPAVVVQARPKAISSFAEKVVRKYARHPDAVNQFTDLCAARIILQTLEQVQAAGTFIESNFEIVEKEDKSTLLDENEFGYRDLHYIIRLNPARASSLGFLQNEIETIGNRTAEIQVRTWLQHAWADILHDRLYKTPIRISNDLVRLGNLQAAVLEEADRNFNNMACTVDEIHANYAGVMPREAVLEEISALDLILENEPDQSRTSGIALRLAQLHAACGAYDQAKSVLLPHHSEPGPLQCEIMQELGNALCRAANAQPESKTHLEGRSLLRRAIEQYGECTDGYAHDIRLKTGSHALAFARLAQALEAIPDQQQAALNYWRQAHGMEPENPYYLADFLFQEIAVERTPIHTTTDTLIRHARRTCREHAIAGIQMPYALFTAARLSLLLDEPYDALGYYTRGLIYVRTGENCYPPDLLEREVRLLDQLRFSDTRLPALDHAAAVFKLMESSCLDPIPCSDPSPAAVISTGGAAHCPESTKQQASILLKELLSEYGGLVVSGGTLSGIPGVTGDVCTELTAAGKHTFKLISYIPDHLPVDAPRHPAYDEHHVCGERFSPAQVIQCWEDLIQRGISPPDVLCIGFGGGPIARFEYQLALAIGASVYITMKSGGTGDEILADPLWRNLPNLYPIPPDNASFRMLAAPSSEPLDEGILEAMAEEFHVRYVEQRGSAFPENMKPWSLLNAGYKRANREQARNVITILTAHGFAVHKAQESPALLSFDGYEEEVEAMAEMEHGRWNIASLREGWRPGATRENQMKINPCIVPWNKLSEEQKSYDREAVRAYPTILARVGLEIVRP